MLEDHTCHTSPALFCSLPEPVSPFCPVSPVPFGVLQPYTYPSHISPLYSAVVITADSVPRLIPRKCSSRTHPQCHATLVPGLEFAPCPKSQFSPIGRGHCLYLYEAGDTWNSQFSVSVGGLGLMALPTCVFLALASLRVQLGILPSICSGKSARAGTVPKGEPWLASFKSWVLPAAWSFMVAHTCNPALER